MSTEYVKTSWQDGDIITADKMNNIENGIKDAEDTIGELKSSFEWYSDNIFAEYTVLTGMFIEDSTHFLRAGISLDRTICIHGEADKKYIFHKDTATTVRIGCGSTPTPVSGTYVNGYVTNGTASNNEIEFKTTANNPYIYIQLFADVDSSSYKSISANIGTLMVIPVDKTICGISENLSDLQELADTKAAAIYETASGEIASFKDGADDMPMKSCVVKMEPVQDLHGYDHPWPAGTGKNIAPYSVENSLCVGFTGLLWENGYTNNKVISTSTGFSFSRLNANYGCGIIIGKLEEDQTYTLKATRSDIDWSCNIVTFDADAVLSSTTGVSRTTVHTNVNIEKGFTFTAQGGNVKYAVGFYSSKSGQSSFEVSNIQLEKGQTATEWSPYSNICPISGRTGLSVTRCGKNLLNNTGSTQTTNGVTFTVNDDGTVSTTGMATDTAVFRIYVSITDLPKADSFIMNGCPAGGDYSNKYSMLLCNIGGASLGEIDIGNGARFTASSLAALAQMQIVIKTGTNTNGLVFKPMIRLASDAIATYEPCKSETYSINWETEAGTVYGGSLDIVSGKLIARYTSIKLSSRRSWSYDANYSRMLIGLDNMVVNKYAKREVPLYCSMAPCVTDGRAFIDIPNNSFYGSGGSSKSVFFQTTDYTTPEEFLAVYGNADLVYELAESIEYQLIPQEVRTLLGENNIWSDGGGMAVEYPADTKLYIDRKIAEALS